MVGQLVMAGVSHTHAAQDVLERAAVRPADLPAALDELRDAGYGEAVVLSTCSRTELYAVAQPGRHGGRDLVDLMRARVGLTGDVAGPTLEVRTGSEVVEHLFAVAAGLESRVVGEADVQAQVRRAYRVGRGAGMTGPLLQRLLPAAVRSAEEAHSRVRLDEHGRSLACRAVDIGLELLAAARAPRTLVVGSGQMATTAVGRLSELGRQVRVAARNEDYAAKLAGPGAVCSLAALVDEIRNADLLICATSASQPVVSADQVHAAMQGRTHPLTVVDLSVPRNVDRAVTAEPGVTVVELAALNDDAHDDPVVLAAVEQARALVHDAAARFVDDLAAREAGPLIRALHEQVKQRCREEILTAGLGLTAEAAEQVAHAAAGRRLHAPTLALRAAAASGDRAALGRLAESLGLAPRAAF